MHLHRHLPGDTPDAPPHRSSTAPHTVEVFPPCHHAAELTAIRGELRHLSYRVDEHSAEFQRVHQRLSTIEGHLADQGQRITTLDHDMTERINTLDHDMTERINTLDHDMTERINSLDRDMTERINALSADLHQRINTLSSDMTERITTLNTDMIERIDAHKHDTLDRFNAFAQQFNDRFDKRWEEMNARIGSIKDSIRADLAALQENAIRNADDRIAHRVVQAEMRFMKWCASATVAASGGLAYAVTKFLQ